MDNKTLISLIDWTLTPQNASSRGYQFMNDILYDSHTSIAFLQEILTMVKEEGFKFGSPQTKDPEFVFGLYVPLKKL